MSRSKRIHVRLYEVLGLDSTKPIISQAEIKKAHRAAAKQHHPDKGGSEARMAEINYAYKVLGDPEKRARYDAEGDVTDRAEDAQLRGMEVLMMAIQATLMSDSNQDPAAGLAAMLSGKPMKYGDFKSKDFLKGVRRCLAQSKLSVNQQIDEHRAQSATLQDVLDRLNFDPDQELERETEGTKQGKREDFLGGAIRSIQLQHDAAVAQGKEKLEDVECAQDMLLYYSYKPDSMPGFPSYRVQSYMPGPKTFPSY
jgi:curved DNA-binding protein CbpA